MKPWQKPCPDEHDHLRAMHSGGSQFGVLRVIGKLLLQVYRGVRAAQIWLETSETKRQIRAGTTSGLLESARLAGPEDAEQLNLFDPGGLHLGYLDDRQLSLKSDWSLVVYGPSGAYKTTSLTLPIAMRLLIGAPDGSRRESIVLLDWKNAELARAIARGLAEITGNPALVFAPYSRDNTISINMFEDLRQAAQRGERIVDAVRARLYTFFAEKIATAGQNSWIEKAALNICLLILTARCYGDPESATPGGLWDFAQASYDDVMHFMEVATEHTDVCDGFVSAGATGFLNHYSDPDNRRELRWIMQSIDDAFSLFALGSDLRRATETTTVDTSQLKRNPGALIISIPDQYIMAAAAFVQAVLECVVEQAAMSDGPVRVNILAEEFSVLPYSLNSTLKWLRVYRALGIRMICVLQDRSGFSAYKADGGYKPFEENSVKIYCGLSDAQHMRDLETRAGKRAVLLETRSTSLGVRIPGGNHGAQEILTPVLPVHEIAQIGPKQAILDIPGQPLFIIDRKPWWEQDDISHLIDDTRFDRP